MSTLTFVLRGNTSKVRTVCVRSARTDLCGGCGATRIPTATGGLLGRLPGDRPGGLSCSLVGGDAGGRFLHPLLDPHHLPHRRARIELSRPRNLLLRIL